MYNSKTNFGRLAYEAYGNTKDWKTYDDKPMPEWEKLPLDVRLAWISAAWVSIIRFEQERLAVEGDPEHTALSTGMRVWPLNIEMKRAMEDEQFGSLFTSE